ncbi:hypothetical protein CYMTET_27834 [Cymbomonas tetramitiformis]|uniref:Sulfotransferase domain-containing protein n=1 Tax=Cymbomonas tetramitiformis TaxID=36881 RepID=A0AAE0FPK2_9CHLO|nr:hypothetical protein CYMTET_27834 [Cymbomonas tetramitiformis]
MRRVRHPNSQSDAAHTTTGITDDVDKLVRTAQIQSRLSLGLAVAVIIFMVVQFHGGSVSSKSSSSGPAPSVQQPAAYETTSKTSEAGYQKSDDVLSIRTSDSGASLVPEDLNEDSKVYGASTAQQIRSSTQFAAPALNVQELASNEGGAENKHVAIADEADSSEQFSIDSNEERPSGEKLSSLEIAPKRHSDIVYQNSADSTEERARDQEHGVSANEAPGDHDSDSAHVNSVDLGESSQTDSSVSTHAAAPEDHALTRAPDSEADVAHTAPESNPVPPSEIRNAPSPQGEEEELAPSGNMGVPRANEGSNESAELHGAVSASDGGSGETEPSASVTGETESTAAGNGETELSPASEGTLSGSDPVSAEVSLEDPEPRGASEKNAAASSSEDKPRQGNWREAFTQGNWREALRKTGAETSESKGGSAPARPLPTEWVGDALNDKCFWRNTADCKPEGRRQPDLDLECDDPIPPSHSGYCECSGGFTVHHMSCMRRRRSTPHCRKFCIQLQQSLTGKSMLKIPYNTVDFALNSTVQHAVPHTRDHEEPDVGDEQSPFLHLSQRVPWQPPGAVHKAIPEIVGAERLKSDCPAHHLGQLRPKNASLGGRRRIQQFSVVAERHTGSNWLREMLANTFALRVQEGFTRFKHWFQTERRNKGFTAHVNSTLVIVAVRNPYDWAKGMYQAPFHAKHHASLSFPDEFLKAPWDLPKSYYFKPDSNQSCTNERGFIPGEVAPCRKNVVQPHADYLGTKPVYERHPVTGEVFSGIMAMRAAKMESYIQMTEWAPHIEFVRYEDLVAGSALGARRWLAALQKKYALPCRRSRAGETGPNAREANKNCTGVNFGNFQSFKRFKGYHKQTVSHSLLESRVFYAQPHNSNRQLMTSMNSFINKSVEECFGYPAEFRRDVVKLRGSYGRPSRAQARSMRLSERTSSQPDSESSVARVHQLLMQRKRTKATAGQHEEHQQEEPNDEQANGTELSGGDEGGPDEDEEAAIAEVEEGLDAERYHPHGVVERQEGQGGIDPADVSGSEDEQANNGSAAGWVDDVIEEQEGQGDVQPTAAEADAMGEQQEGQGGVQPTAAEADAMGGSRRGRCYEDQQEGQGVQPAAAETDHDGDQQEGQGGVQPTAAEADAMGDQQEEQGGVQPSAAEADAMGEEREGLGDIQPAAGPVDDVTDDDGQGDLRPAAVLAY